MYKIMTICVNGVGTSIMAKKLVSNSISELGYNIKDIEIDETSFSKVETVSCDLLITTAGLGERIPDSDFEKIIGVLNNLKELYRLRFLLKDCAALIVRARPCFH